MSYSSTTSIQRVDSVLAEARALKYAVAHRAISYEEAKRKAEALLQVVNAVAEKIAKKYGRRYRKIRFTDL